jgi:hypothetical protein
MIPVTWLWYATVELLTITPEHAYTATLAATRYTCLLFLFYNKFALQPNRKTTNVLDSEDLEIFASAIMTSWVCTNSSRFSLEAHTGDTHGLGSTTRAEQNSFPASVSPKVTVGATAPDPKTHPTTT